MAATLELPLKMPLPVLLLLALFAHVARPRRLLRLCGEGGGVLVGVDVWEGREEPWDVWRRDFLHVVKGRRPGLLLLHGEGWQGVGKGQVLLPVRLQHR
jgi:hypothetical protein